MKPDLRNFIIEKVWENTQEQLSGRYINFEMIAPVIFNLPKIFRVENIGCSFQNRGIYSITFGTGKIKILTWTQMHGNESTGTKAVFDILKLIDNHIDNEFVKNLFEKCTVQIIPMLNPDGAEVYTRLNAQKIDLNRDVIDKKAPETQLLLKALRDFNPDYCFNLHDQRTIFSVTKAKLPATLSFLAPSIDKKRTITEGRKKTMKVITAMFSAIQPLLFNQMGRYTDEFYPTATGDNFEKMGYHTILIEAGHFSGDYQREKVRKYNAMALLFGWFFISGQLESPGYKSYFDIPENEKNYLDIIIKNCEFEGKTGVFDTGITFKEVLSNGRIIFKPEINQDAEVIQSNADIFVNLKNRKFKGIRQLEKFIPKIIPKN